MQPCAWPRPSSWCLLLALLQAYAKGREYLSLLLMLVLLVMSPCEHVDHLSESDPCFLIDRDS